jgi:hypothetical protein
MATRVRTAPIFRVVVFGTPRAPWRPTRIEAQRDAIEMDLGSFDEWGQFYVTVPADIEVGSVTVVEQVAA